MEHLGFPTETVIILIAAVFGSLIVDFLAHRADKEISFTSACLWSLFWIAVSILFGGYIYFHHGREMASLFFTGYVLVRDLRCSFKNRTADHYMEHLSLNGNS